MLLHWLNRNNVDLILFDCNVFWMISKLQVISYSLLSRNRLSTIWAMPINDFQRPNTERSQNDCWVPLKNITYHLHSMQHLSLYCSLCLFFSKLQLFSHNLIVLCLCTNTKCKFVLIKQNWHFIQIVKKEMYEI